MIFEQLFVVIFCFRTFLFASECNFLLLMNICPLQPEGLKQQIKREKENEIANVAKC